MMAASALPMDTFQREQFHGIFHDCLYAPLHPRLTAMISYLGMLKGREKQYIKPTSDDLEVDTQS